MMNEQLKRQALELIISLYLQRTKDQDLVFLNNNFGSTSSVATGIRTHLLKGLSYDNIQINKIQYGQNAKLRSPKCSSLANIVINEICSIYFICITIICLIAEIYGRYTVNYLTYSQAQLILIVNVIAIIVRIGFQGYFCWQFRIYSLLKDKTNLYQVFRNGKLLEIPEHQLVVGDIVQLGFKQKVPASGLIISNKQIFVKQGKNETKCESKMNLQNCLNKIKGLNSLDLKLCYQGKNLPSPVLIRGSQLKHGSTFRMMILSVTQQLLLQQHQFQEEDRFTFRKYDEWVTQLELSWKKKSLIAIILMTILIVFADLINLDMIVHHQSVTFHIFCQILLKISIWFLILNPANLKTFLKIKQLSLLIQVQMPENWSEYLTAQRIMCDEKNIVKSDVIRVIKYAVCQKMQIVDQADIQQLNPITFSIISQIQEIFDIESQCQFKKQLSDEEKLSKFIIINKKKTKIISCPTVRNSDSNLMRRVYNQIAKVSDNQVQYQPQYKDKHRLSVKLQKNYEKVNSHRLLTPIRDNSDHDNINEIINSRCQIKSRGILAGIVELAEKGCKTYYFQAFDNQRMEEITHLINNGIICPITEEDRQRMKMLARKISLLYDLTPVMLGFRDGSYNQKPLRTLACLIGVSISQDNKILNSLKQLQKVGIKSMVVIYKNISQDDQQSNQQEINDQYIERKWIQNGNQHIKDIHKIQKLCGRLVCSYCLITNCDCKDKIQELSHIQPFIQQVNSTKLLYNVDQQSLSYLEKAYTQLKLNYITINSPNTSALAIIQSIKNCMLFVDTIVRSLCLWYLLAILFVFNSLVFWARNIDVLTIKQVVIIYGISQIQLLICLIIKINTNLTSTTNKKTICLINKKQIIFINLLVIFAITFTQILYKFSYLIPEVSDQYDQIIQEAQLSRQCKYNLYENTISNGFRMQACNYGSGMQGVVYSKISTMIIMYLYYLFWVTVVVKHRNVRSVLGVVGYVVVFGVGVVGCVWWPQYVYLYPYGISYVQVLVVGASVVITVAIAVLFTELILLQGNFLAEYFGQQLESTINFDTQKSSQHYSHILNKYYRAKNFKKQNQ